MPRPPRQGTASAGQGTASAGQEYQRDGSTEPGKKRTRRPTLRGVLTQARRAGVVVRSIQFTPDGSIIIVAGDEKKSAPASTSQEGQDTANDDWDVL